MDNQQERTPSLDFVAGLAVGEGCFYLAVMKVRNRGGTKRANASGGYRITPGFRLFMDDRESILLAAQTLKEAGLPVYLGERKDGSLGIHATGAKRVKRYVDTLLPLLTGTKRQAASKVGEFIERRLARPHGANYTDEELQLVRDLRQINGNRNGRKNPV